MGLVRSEGLGLGRPQSEMSDLRIEQTVQKVAGASLAVPVKDDPDKRAG